MVFATCGLSFVGGIYVGLVCGALAGVAAIWWAFYRE